MGADEAVPVHGSMGLTFGRADSASLGASHKLRLDEGRARVGEPGDDPGGSEADVRTIRAGSNAANKVGHVRLAKTRVGTGS